MGRSMLLLVSGLVILAGIIIASNNKRAGMLPGKSEKSVAEVQARNSSVSLITTAIEKLTIDNEWTGSLESGDLLPGEAKLVVYDARSSSYPDGITVGEGGWDAYKILLYSKATYDGYEVITEVMMRRDSFSKYSYFSDIEKSTLLGGADIYFHSKDEITGPVHTNDAFHISGTPTFYGAVTSPSMWRSRNLLGDNPDFQSTTDFNSPVKNLPGATQISNLERSAKTEGLHFDKAIIALFQSNGSVNIYQYDYANNVWGSGVNYPASVHKGLISTSREAFVKGKVKGPITLHSKENMEILGDIEYVDDPRTNPNSTDLLGLVSEKNVIVDKNAHADNGSSDLTLHGSIMALGDSFVVEDYNRNGFKGNLNLLGGIIQKSRGPVGTFGSWTGDTGYAKKYNYDDRLRYSIPPHFPRESVFSILSWKDRVVNKDDELASN